MYTNIVGIIKIDRKTNKKRRNAFRFYNENFIFHITYYPKNVKFLVLCIPNIKTVWSTTTTPQYTHIRRKYYMKILLSNFHLKNIFCIKIPFHIHIFIYLLCIN